MQSAGHALLNYLHKGVAVQDHRLVDHDLEDLHCVGEVVRSQQPLLALLHQGQGHPQQDLGALVEQRVPDA